jgi:hypothetical protein
MTLEFRKASTLMRPTVSSGFSCAWTEAATRRRQARRGRFGFIIRFVRSRYGRWGV